MTPKATVLPLCLLVAMAACGGSASVTGAPGPSPSATPDPTTVPPGTAEPSLDANLVASHEAACQAEFADRNWTGLDRVLVAQPNGHALHIYFDGSGTAYCFPSPTPSVPDALAVGRAELRSEAVAPYLTSWAGIHVAATAFDMEFFYGQADPVVAGLTVTAKRSALDPAKDTTWRVVAVMQDGWYLIVAAEEHTPDVHLSSWNAEDWVVFDSCGRVISNITMGDAPTPCPPNT